MVLDFMGEPTTETKGYDGYDLQGGKGYAEGLIEEGLTLEPFYGFNLEGFISWAEEQLNHRCE